MRKLMKPLLTVIAVVSLAPMAAFALPPQCSDWCEWWTCADPCSVGNRHTTCGAEYPSWCNPSVSAEPTDLSASLTSEEASQADDASRVCSEKDPAVEQSASAEL